MIGDDAGALSELDRLNAACAAAPGEIAPQIALWRAVVGLDWWYFINRGTPEAPRPYALAAADGNMLCIYSSPERAREAAVLNGLTPDGTGLEVLATPLPQAVDWAMSFAQHGVDGVAIDHPQLAAWTPLANLGRAASATRPGVTGAEVARAGLSRPVPACPGA